ALAGELIDEGSRLMAIADIFAALTEDRPYRKAMTSGEALALIERGAGTMVDAQLVEVAKRVLMKATRVGDLRHTALGAYDAGKLTV
ncbi:MAG TPA: HD domain-containing phosphohydrolase, partial [Desulfosporosinus sp.]